jgi:rod shape-determining protein MreD
MKLRYAVYFLILFIIFLIQSAWIARLLQWGSQPAIYLIFLLWLGYQEGRQPTQIIGFLSGFFLDLLMGLPIGISSFVLTLFGFLAGTAKGRFIYDNLFYPMVLAFLSVIYKYLLYHVLFFIFQLEQRNNIIFSGHLVLELFFTSLVAPFIFILATSIKNRFVKSYGGFQGG